MSQFDKYCSCGEQIVKSVNGQAKIRSKILLVKGNVAYAVCKSCNEEVRIPYKLEAEPAPLPLYIKK